MESVSRPSPLDEVHRELGGRLVDFAGFRLPVRYSGVTAEHRAVREAAGLFDVSHMGEFVLQGPGACAALQYIVAGDVDSLEAGQAMYTVCCNEQGGILDDLIVYRLQHERFVVVCNAANRTKLVSHFRQLTAQRCQFVDRSDDYALMALQGPKAESILRACGAEADLTGLAPFRLARGDLCGRSIIAARTGYTGEDGFELFCEPDAAVPIWRQVMKKSDRFGLQPAGLGARDTLRLEARLCLYGQDIDESTNPFEAGIGWVVNLSKPSFLGQSALQACKRQGVSRKLVGFQMRGRGIARTGYPVLDRSGERIGRVTSGGPGLTVGHNLGLAYVPTAASKRGTELGIEIRGKVVKAEVVRTPFYKRQR
ncbi:MAG: glycine cleavage system aminomethyltransferase GcvT [Proteobacteria bacterium]|nr:glycine cleavage system aminomethyltransferase GcvT [Pseudomonadota bacterium]